MFTMGDIAQRSQFDEELFYRMFGIDGEIIVDHAWGIEPVTMQDIKSYRSTSHSLSNGQVLPKPYEYEPARNVFREMVETLCTDMFTKRVVARSFGWWVSYDYKSLEKCPNYDGPICVDYYGRLHPRHSNGSAKLSAETNSVDLVADALLRQFDERTDHRLLYRRLGVCANEITTDIGAYQISMFFDYGKLEKENNLRAVMQQVRRQYGANAIFKGANLMEGATALERNLQIGGHRA